jgi:hypothetical protein
MNIVCLLSVRPCMKTYNFFKDLQLRSDYEVYIVVDDNTHFLPPTPVKIIQLDNGICEKEGYKSSVLTLDNCACSRDKALYYFNKNQIKYDFIWFVEEDVFIPSIQTLVDIDIKYPTQDLLVPSNTVIHEKETIWHWEHVYKQIQIDLPYAHAMISAIRCSKQLVDSIGAYAEKYKNLFLDEALFNTIAIHSNLTIESIDELSTVVYRREWQISEMDMKHLYHPIKDIEFQYLYRDILELFELSHI